METGGERQLNGSEGTVQHNEKDREQRESGQIDRGATSLRT